MACTNGTEYQFMRSSCQATCDNPKLAEQCRFLDSEGCYCPDGLYLRDEECVPLADCGCRLVDGSYVDVSIYLQTATKIETLY